jgi:hypothetical protein
MDTNELDRKLATTHAEQYQNELLVQHARKKIKAELAPREDWTQTVSIVEFDQPRPNVFMRADGRQLGYQGELHSVWGYAGSGKSWLCAYFAAQEVIMHKDVWWFDLEGQRSSIASRFRACGLSDEQIATFVHYNNPENAPDIEKLRQAVAGSLVVFDSFTGLQNRIAPGSSQNDTDAVDLTYSTVLVPLLNSGCTVLVIDHVTKERAGGSDAPIGSQRKLSMLTMGWNLIAKDGYSSLTCWKDRHANFERGESVAALQWTDGRPMLSEHAQEAPGATEKPRKRTAQQQIVAAVIERERGIATQQGPFAKHFTKNSLVTYMMDTAEMSESTGKRYVTTLLDEGILVHLEGIGSQSGQKIIRTAPTHSRQVTEG